jgi:hypothetical protein
VCLNGIVIFSFLQSINYQSFNFLLMVLAL